MPDATVYNLTVEGVHTYYAGTNPVLVHNCGTGGSQADGGFGRGGQRLGPDEAAEGSPHSTFRRDPASGQVNHYTTWEPNSMNPRGYDVAKRYDGVGGSHYNKIDHVDVPTPHIQGPGVPGGVRPAEPWETPA